MFQIQDENQTSSSVSRRLLERRSEKCDTHLVGKKKCQVYVTFGMECRRYKCETPLIVKKNCQVWDAGNWKANSAKCVSPME